MNVIRWELGAENIANARIARTGLAGRKRRRKSQIGKGDFRDLNYHYFFE